MRFAGLYPSPMLPGFAYHIPWNTLYHYIPRQEDEPDVLWLKDASFHSVLRLFSHRPLHPDLLVCVSYARVQVLLDGATTVVGIIFRTPVEQSIDSEFKQSGDILHGAIIYSGLHS